MTFGDKLGDQLGTRTTRMVRDEQPAAIDERALLDQVDDPDFVQIVSLSSRRASSQDHAAWA